MKLYPLWKVRVYFSLCPMVGGWMAFLYMCIDTSRIHSRDVTNLIDVFWLLRDYIFGPLVFGVVAFILYSIPSVIIAFVYAPLKLHRTWSTCAVVALVGGEAAHLWTAVFILLVDDKADLLAAISGGGWLGWLGLFHLGAISSLVAALMAFPKRGAAIQNTVNCGEGGGDGAAAQEMADRATQNKLDGGAKK